MDNKPVIYHGTLADTFQVDWKEPKLVAECNSFSRKGYTELKAHEYLDDPQVLDQKLEILANLIKTSNNFVAYTGAGISTNAGINDYATKAKKTVTNHNQVGSMKSKKPTESHYILSSMERASLLKHWIQQNHDGLAQKSGYPNCLDKLNEIHGTWWDKSAPVVKMKQKLREKNFSKLIEWTEKVDFTLALGTSLSGMNSDQVCIEAANRFLDYGIGQGLAIINIQRTQLDNLCQLRIYADLDKAMGILAKKLGLNMQRHEVQLKEYDSQIIDFKTWLKQNPWYETEQEKEKKIENKNNIETKQKTEKNIQIQKNCKVDILQKPKKIEQKEKQNKIQVK